VSSDPTFTRVFAFHAGFLTTPASRASATSICGSTIRAPCPRCCSCRG